MSHLPVRCVLLSSLLLLLALSWGCAASFEEAQETLESEEEFAEVSQALFSPPRPSGATWSAGQGLCDGQRVTTPNMTIVMQRDGNLVVYQNSDNRPRWASHTAGKRVGGQLARCAVMQGDGNFVLYTAAGRAVWNTGTQGHPGATAQFVFLRPRPVGSCIGGCPRYCFSRDRRGALRIYQGSTLIRSTTGSITCR